MIFKLTNQEIEYLKDWLKIHDSKCLFGKPENQGAIGGRLTYEFTPTSLGVVTKVVCACGEYIDLTLYDTW